MEDGKKKCTRCGGIFLEHGIARIGYSTGDGYKICPDCRERQTPKKETLDCYAYIKMGFHKDLDPNNRKSEK